MHAVIIIVDRLCTLEGAGWFLHCSLDAVTSALRRIRPSCPIVIVVGSAGPCPGVTAD